MSDLPVVCLMGPTATGKTALAVRLQEHFPLTIISVDSALVYREMSIGTAKPDAETLARAPHKLIDIRDPEESYSAGEFVTDASREIDAAHASGRIPLLVGGTMMYFRSLTGGLAELPTADAAVRNALDFDAQRKGWPEMHRRLMDIDPLAAQRINKNDAQRIQRALEVYELSGRRLSDWHADGQAMAPPYRFLKLALLPGDRAQLHARIEQRLATMIEQGFADEVRTLMMRPGLTADSPAMRSVGYRQVWAALADETDLETAVYKALVATRQLAKRQMTWMRAESDLSTFDPLSGDPFCAIRDRVAAELSA